MAFLSSGDRTAVFKEDWKWPDSNDKLTIFRITGKSKSKCCVSRVAGSGSKIQDFMMILLAMFDSSVLNVGAKFTSWQVSIEVSRVEGIRNYRCPKITSDIDDFLLNKVDEFIGEINCGRDGREKFIPFPVKKTSNCAKQSFAVTFSWIDKARLVIHFWFENGVLYNSAFFGIWLIVRSGSRERRHRLSSLRQITFCSPAA